MAKPKTINIDNLCREAIAGLADGARNYMRLSGQKKVKNMMSEAIEEKVYDRYTPKKYERRGELKNVKNMSYEVVINYYIKYNKNDMYDEGHLYITNKAKRNILPGAKKKYGYTKKADFLYGIEDGSDTDEYDYRIGNFCHSSTFDEWGHGGQPLYINAEIDKKVEKSHELRKELRQSALIHARKQIKKKMD